MNPYEVESTEPHKPRRRRLAAPVIGVFAGGAVHANLPPGLFGDYDIPIRAVVTGMVAGVTVLTILVIRRKGNVNP